MAVGNIHQFLRDPGVVGLEKFQVGGGMAHVRVEPRRDDDEVRAEILEPRQNGCLHRVAELLAPVAWTQRRVDDGVLRATFRYGASAGIEWHLMRRAIHHGRVVPENVLAAVAVMYVEIDDRNALGAVGLLRMTCRD